MSNIEDDLEELEQSINKTEKAFLPSSTGTTTSKSNKIILPYIYMVAFITPVLLGILLFVSKPKWVLKENSKKKIRWVNLIKWTGILSLVVFITLFALNYYYKLDKYAFTFNM